MENSSINPVTENEMRAFAERMVTSFVSLSEQAKMLVQVQVDLAQLRSQVDRTNYELTQLRQSNEDLRHQIETLVAERDNARKDAADNLSLAQTYERERNEAREQVESDKRQAEYLNSRINDQARRVQELEVSFGQASTERDMAKSKLAKLQEHFRSVFEEAKAEPEVRHPVVQSMQSEPKPEVMQPSNPSESRRDFYDPTRF